MISPDDLPLELLARLVLAPPLLALLLAALPTILRRFNPGAGLLGWATRLLSAVSLVCSILLALGPKAEFPLRFAVLSVGFYIDALSVYFVLLVNLVAFFASWYTVDFLSHDAVHNREFHAPESFHFFFNAFHLTMLVVPMVDNLVILWMAIELTTLASTLLVRYRRRRPTLEATWKYIIITTAGIVFALFGTILMTNAVAIETDPQDCTGIARVLNQPVTDCSELQARPGVDLMGWSVLARRPVAELLNEKLIIVSFLFILIGYGTKAGLAPMHTWLPDGHGEAPSPVSALLSGVLLKSALYAILRFYTITNLALESTSFTSTILLAAGLLSLGLATPFILKRNKFKRVLAYHSLEHMGIIVFGLGIGGAVALFGALLHALNHALIKALMFLTYGNVRRAYARRQGVSEPDEERVTGVLQAMLGSGVILLFGGLGLVGSPPFNIFLSEFIILWAAFQRIVQPSSPKQGSLLPVGVYILAVVLFLATVTLIFGGLVGHLARLLLEGTPGRSPAGAEEGEWPAPGDDAEPGTGLRDRVGQLIPLLALAGIIVLFGVWIPRVPVDFFDLLVESVRILQDGARP